MHSMGDKRSHGIPFNQRSVILCARGYVTDFSTSNLNLRGGIITGCWSLFVCKFHWK